MDSRFQGYILDFDRSILHFGRAILEFVWLILHFTQHIQKFTFSTQLKKRERFRSLLKSSPINLQIDKVVYLNNVHRLMEGLPRLFCLCLISSPLQLPHI